MGNSKLFLKQFKIYVFDLDNTLIFTDKLNNDSYAYALNQLKLSEIYDCARVTRDIVFNAYPNLGIEEQNKIIELKQRFFSENLNETKLNQDLYDVLTSKNPVSCVLWTSADEFRVQFLLNHHKIENCFRSILYSKKDNLLHDINEICDMCKCKPTQLIFYEDNKNVINKLLKLKLQVIYYNLKLQITQNI